MSIHKVCTTLNNLQSVGRLHIGIANGRPQTQSNTTNTVKQAFRTLAVNKVHYLTSRRLQLSSPSRTKPTLTVCYRRNIGPLTLKFWNPTVESFSCADLKGRTSHCAHRHFKMLFYIQDLKSKTFIVVLYFVTLSYVG